MAVVAQSLRIVGRAALRVYTSDTAYQAGVLLAVGVVVMAMALAVAAQKAPAPAPALPAIENVCWLFDPPCE